MSDVESVLAGFVPIGPDHPKAQETHDSVLEMIVARAKVERVDRLDRLDQEIARLRAELDELRRTPDE